MDFSIKSEVVKQGQAKVTVYDIQYDGYNEITANRDAYWRDISSRFSFKYERYIIDPEHNPKPDVFTFK